MSDDKPYTYRARSNKIGLSSFLKEQYEFNTSTTFIDWEQVSKILAQCKPTDRYLQESCKKILEETKNQLPIGWGMPTHKITDREYKFNANQPIDLDSLSITWTDDRITEPYADCEFITEPHMFKVENFTMTDDTPEPIDVTVDISDEIPISKFEELSDALKNLVGFNIRINTNCGISLNSDE